MSRPRLAPAAATSRSLASRQQGLPLGDVRASLSLIPALNEILHPCNASMCVSLGLGVMRRTWAAPCSKLQTFNKSFNRESELTPPSNQNPRLESRARDSTGWDRSVDLPSHALEQQTLKHRLECMRWVQEQACRTAFLDFPRDSQLSKHCRKHGDGCTVTVQK